MGSSIFPAAKSLTGPKWPRIHNAETLLSQSPADRERPPAHQKDLGQEDIYRGIPPLFPQRPPSLSPSSAPSSSGWSGFGPWRGPLGAMLELAINRWARVRSGVSVSSTSSSAVHTHLPRPRRRRLSSATSALDTQSENIIRLRRKGGSEYRIRQREFILFLPAALLPTSEPSQSDQRRILRTASLSLVLDHLDLALKGSSKPRRPKQTRATPPSGGLESWYNDYMQLEPSFVASQVEAPRQKKGKTQEKPRMPSPEHKSQVLAIDEGLQKHQTWWLDVSNPTWSDMREIGKVLHLHPLTLEDILHQEPREKLELFPRLGYYFIVFRALESERTRSGPHTDSRPRNETAPFQDNIFFGTNVYIVVFRDGICSFHFEDIATHVDRVRHKMLSLEETAHLSPDWIAHGILDSIVDDFFPLLNSIEQEIKYLDDRWVSDEGSPKPFPSENVQEPPDSDLDQAEKTSNLVVDEKEKKWTDLSRPGRISFWRKHFAGGGLLSCLSSFCSRFGALLPMPNLVRGTPFWIRSRQVPSSPSLLIRMASTRRLVTSLTRLLGTKSEVVSQLQKRLKNGTCLDTKAGPCEQALAVEVSIYLGDIQDHILTLQHSLVYCERKLSHSHPGYLSHLRVSMLKARDGMDQALLVLTLISVSELAMQTLTGVFSLNVHREPTNLILNGTPSRPPPFYWFGGVFVLVGFVGACVIYLTLHWWWKAKKKYARL